MHATYGRLHAAAFLALRDAARRARALRSERGQGTVEYVGLVMLMAVVLTAIVTAGKGVGTDIPKTIVGEVKEAITRVGGSGGSAK